MKELDANLLSDALLSIPQTSGCHIAGMLVGGRPCWFAWGPFGVFLRTFASYWEASGAVVHAVRQGWANLDADKEAELVRLGYQAARGVRVSARPLDGAQPDLVIVELEAGGDVKHLVAELHYRLCQIIFAASDEAEEFARSLPVNNILGR